MSAYAEAVFKARQSTPLGVFVNKKSYLPTRSAINSSVESILESMRTKFSRQLPELLTNVGGAVSIDGVLKIKGRHNIDFTLHHVYVVKQKDKMNTPQFCIKTSTILFLESHSKSASRILYC